MKRIILTGVVSAVAAVSFAGTASAASAAIDPAKPNCFGQVHKAVNAADALVPGVDNVGVLLKEVIKGNGQDKKAFVNENIC